MNNTVLDEIDLKILAILQENGKSSYAEIGRSLNLSRSGVRERVKKLEKQGIIEKYTIVINPYKMGLEFSVFIELDVEPRFLLKVASELSEEKNVESVNQMTGPSSLHIHAIFKNKRHFENFLVDIVFALDGIINVRSYILIRSFKSKTGGYKIG